MENSLIEKENWLTRNWKWFLPSTLFSILLIVLLLTSTSKENIIDITQAYADNLLFEEAIKKANEDSKTIENIGKIEPIDKLAILEGNIVYSNNHNTVNASIRINGTKNNGKLDIFAIKKGAKWDYQKISIRTKNPNNEIVISEKL